MAQLVLSSALIKSGYVQGAERPAYKGVLRNGLLHSAQRDWRFGVVVPNGTITDNNRVMVKPSPTDPEVPMQGARVRLHRLLDGYCAWEGISDANGYYWPRGLEVGLAYYPVAIDLTGTHECDAAGPVIAIRAG